jgi:hypothetical protein
MHINRVLLAGLVVAGVAACDSDPVSKEVSPEPFSSIRWVNGVPDTVAMDYRVVDYPSNASEPNLAFRASSGNWRNLPPGTHRVRVFFTNTTAAGRDVSVVSQIFVDTTLAFDLNKKYTILHYGFAKNGATPKQRLILIPDELPSVPAGQIAVRVINATTAPVDVYANEAAAAGGAVSGTPRFTNVAPGAATAWVTLPAVATGSYRVSATPAAGATLLADALAPVGLPAVPSTTVAGVVSQPLDAVAGTQQAQSALTFVVFGPAVSYVLRTPTGASSTVAGTSTGGVTTLLDLHPPRISP